MLRALLFKTVSKVTVGPLACSQQLQIFISVLQPMEWCLLYALLICICCTVPQFTCAQYSILCQDAMKWHEFCGTFPDVIPLLCVAVVINSALVNLSSWPPVLFL